MEELEKLKEEGDEIDLKSFKINIQKEYFPPMYYMHTHVLVFMLHRFIYACS